MSERRNASRRMLPVLAIVLAAVASGCVAPAREGRAESESDPCTGTQTDKVTRVVDGDALDVERCGRIRLALVNTPERGEEGYAEASDFARSTCPEHAGAEVDYDARQPRDATGTRRVAQVTCGGVILNAALLEAHHAVVLRAYCDKSEFGDSSWARDACGGSAA